jgi:histone H3/H4
MHKIETEEIARFDDFVKEHVQQQLRRLPAQELVSLDSIEAMARDLAVRVSELAFEAWVGTVEEMAVAIAGPCTSCGRRRKVKRRTASPMTVNVLGQAVTVPKLYLECSCGAVGVSITRLLTGLSSGDKSAELELMAAYCGAEQSYGKASQDLEAHHGQAVERTAVRRMALEVEREAVQFAQNERRDLLEQVSQERRHEGLPRLMLTGDGGIVRTGTLVPCEPRDPGYGKKTPKTGRERRKRVTQYREIIALDVREPGEMAATARDVVVPLTAATDDERSQRMLALAARKGLGDNTEVFGLGDMGSSLASSFDEAFVGRDPKALYSADWKHTTDYVDNAASVLDTSQPKRWAKAMKDALWNRKRKKVDRLLTSARNRRVHQLPHHLDKCPVQTLATYIDNNWHRLLAKTFKDKGLDFVSARAEAMVRDQIKSRYAVPGAWLGENLEGKAILRAIIADGRWPAFRAHYLHARAQAFETGLAQRLHDAVAQGRLRADVLQTFGLAGTKEEFAAAA